MSPPSEPHAPAPTHIRRSSLRANKYQPRNGARKGTSRVEEAFELAQARVGVFQQRAKGVGTSSEGEPRVVEFSHAASTSLKRRARVAALLSWRIAMMRSKD